MYVIYWLFCENKVDLDLMNIFRETHIKVSVAYKSIAYGLPSGNSDTSCRPW